MVIMRFALGCQLDIPIWNPLVCFQKHLYTPAVMIETEEWMHSHVLVLLSHPLLAAFALKTYQMLENTSVVINIKVK